MNFTQDEIDETLNWVLELLESDVAQHEREPYEADTKRRRMTEAAFKTLVAVQALAECKHDHSFLDEEGYTYTCASCGATSSARDPGTPKWEPLDLVGNVLAATRSTP